MTRALFHDRLTAVQFRRLTPGAGPGGPVTWQAIKDGDTIYLGTPI